MTSWTRVGTWRMWGLAACLVWAAPADTAETPADWPEGVARLDVTPPQTGGMAPSAEGSEEEGLRRVSMDFQDANLKDVLKIFSQQTGINVIAGEDIGDQAITLYLEGVTVLDALDQILGAAGLLYERPLGSEIYIVRRRPEAPPATITRVYRLKYARVSRSVLARAAASFGRSTPFEARAGLVAASGGGSGGGGGSAAGAAGSPSASGGDEGVGIDVVMKDLLTDQGAVVVDERTNSLLLTDIPENFPRLEAALAALDVRTPQIMIDAEVIETTLGKVKDLGFEWGTGSEGDLFDITLGSRKSRFPWGSKRLGENIAPDDQTDFSATIVDFTSTQGFLQALQSDTDTKVLARPKILTLDNESAVIRLTTEEAVGFQTTETAESGNVTSEPERATTGVLLVVTPQVNEAGYVTMLVEPVVTRTVAAKIAAPSGQATPRDPRTRSSRTLVRVRSGDTLVVGGLIDRSEEGSVRSVPVLSGIPFLGEAFKNQEINNSATELLVFVTPRILGDRDPQVAAVPVGPAGPREQEPIGGRQSVIEQTLSELEQSRL